MRLIRRVWKYLVVITAYLYIPLGITLAFRGDDGVGVDLPFEVGAAVTEGRRVNVVYNSASQVVSLDEFVAMVVAAEYKVSGSSGDSGSGAVFGTEGSSGSSGSGATSVVGGSSGSGATSVVGGSSGSDGTSGTGGGSGSSGSSRDSGSDDGYGSDSDADEVVKALAVVVRSDVVAQMGKREVIDSDRLENTFLTKTGMKNRWGDEWADVFAKILALVKETSGEVLVVGGSTSETDKTDGVVQLVNAESVNETGKADGVVQLVNAVSVNESGKAGGVVQLVNAVSVNETGKADGVEILYGECVRGVYTRVSAGVTMAGEKILGEEYGYLVAVECEEDKESDEYTFSVEYGSAEFVKQVKAWEKSTGYDCGLDADNPIRDCQITAKTDEGYVTGVQVGDLCMSGEMFAQMMGVKSAFIALEYRSDSIKITSTGVGCGMGMSLYAANVMAAGGSTYREILARFYPKCEMSSVV